MWAYISEFVLPVWLISEWVIQGIKVARGVDYNILSSLAVIGAVCVFFVSGLIYSIRKYSNSNIFAAVKQALETAVYMVAIWTPIVSFIVFKIIFMKRAMDWHKTTHGQDALPELKEKLN
ncbi:MAG: hypothetical protein MZV64_26595 [Ignavibacteriales bacterium]|nr:hypothetical protein [Ignavibacteriales bacterium]